MSRILLVDDDQNALTLVRHGLEADGHAVTALTDSRDAHGIITADPMAYDLLITDISMPDIDGIALATDALAARASLPIIMMSGMSGELSRAEALKTKHVTFLSKPLARDQIRDAVRSILGEPRT